MEPREKPTEVPPSTRNQDSHLLLPPSEAGVVVASETSAVLSGGKDGEALPVGWDTGPPRGVTEVPVLPSVLAEANPGTGELEESSCFEIGVGGVTQESLSPGQELVVGTPVLAVVLVSWSTDWLP